MELDDLGRDPIAAFGLWHLQARSDAVVLATVSPAGKPAARVVLLKGADERGFEFHTSYIGAKAEHLAATPHAALVFHWPPDRQVRVTGNVEVLSPAESDAYWVTRPRASQLGAWASEQSATIGSRAELEARRDEVAERFDDRRVPRPDFWGGYRVIPETIEFWHHRDDRMHDRIRYTRHEDHWVIDRLQP